VWQRGGAPGGLTAGNLEAWRTGFGSAAGAAVPEPGALGLLLVLIAIRLIKADRRKIAVNLVASLGLMVTTNGTSSAADVTATWNGTTGNWSDSTKWNSALFPNNGNGGLTYDAVINGGTVTLDQNITLEGLALTGGEVTGLFHLLLEGDSTWKGLMSGGGQTVVGPSGTLLISDVSAARLHRTLVNNGAAMLGVNSALDMAGGTFQNNGSFTANSALLQEVRGFGNVGTVNTFNNAGTFTKQGVAQLWFKSFTRGVQFNNSGTVDIQGGELILQNGGTHTGDFSITAGTTLWLSGVHDFAATADVASAGSMQAYTNALVNFNGPRTISGSFTIRDGSIVNFNGATTLNDVTLSSGSLAGTGDVAVTGAATWSGGTMSGTGQTIVAPGGTLVISSGINAITGLQRTLVNQGSATWSFANGRGDVGFTNGTFQNNGSFVADASGGTLRLVSSGLAATVNAFNNAGTFTKTGAGQVRTFAHTQNVVKFNNSGTVDIQQGELVLENGGTHSGDFNIASGSTLWLSGSHQLAAGAEVSGPGPLRVYRGATEFQGSVSLDSVINFDSGILTLADGGIHTATFNIAAAGTLRLAGTHDFTAASSVFNEGAIEVYGGTTEFNGIFQSNGRIVVSGGATATIATLTVAQGGALQLDNGTLAAQAVILDQGGALSGNGTVATADLTVADGGLISPGFSVGALQIDGDLDQQRGGQLLIEIDSTSSYDVVDVAGVADLGGTHTVEIMDGAISLGDEFTVLTAGSLAPGSKFDAVKTVTDGAFYLAADYDEGGSVTLTSLLWADADNDDEVTAADIAGIVLGLRDPDQFTLDYPFRRSPMEFGNIDGDEDFDFDDIDLIYERIFSSSMTVVAFEEALADAARVPEPSTWLLGLLGGVMLGRRTRAWRRGLPPELN
jgi:hypothetical protein